jgi:hypothetical protein
MTANLIVTHHAPDLDAIGAVWLLKRFDAQHFADAKVAFVNPGATITEAAAEELGFSLDQVTHVDTGLGEFDHHQPELGGEFICASSLVFNNHLCQIHPDLRDDQVLHTIVDFITESDHFQEIYWPEADHLRYSFMLQELIRGHESVDPHNDDSQLHFGMECLDNAYAIIKNQLQARSEIAQKGQPFQISQGECLAIETKNDEAIKIAQKQGSVVVVRKDPKGGHIRIKARPDADLDLQKVYQAILKLDSIGTWYYHPSGKMLLNGSNKHRDQKPSPLTIPEVITILQEVYGQ